MKIKYFVTLRAPRQEVRRIKVKVSPISYIYEDLYSRELQSVAVPARQITFSTETSLLILCRDKYWCLL